MGDINKVRNIISKLKRLECPVLENSDDGWAMEVLFKPNFERYQIIEWIFFKLEFSLPDISTNQNSSERKAENLLAAVSALGLCHEKDSNIIQGTASVQDQLKLWNLLVNILWKKCCLSQKGENASVHRISEEYNRSRDYIHKLCNDVSLKALFDKKVQLFPPNVLEESKQSKLLRSGMKSSEEIKSLDETKALEDTKSLEEIKFLANAALTNSAADISVNISDTSKQLRSIVYNVPEFSQNEELIELEADISSSLSDLQNLASSEFNEAYLSLKPYLSNASRDDTKDLGQPFKDAHLKLKTLTNLNKSLSLLKESEKDLSTLNSDLKDYHLNSEPLSGSLLGEYITILNDCKSAAEEK